MSQNDVIGLIVSALLVVFLLLGSGGVGGPPPGTLFGRVETGPLTRGRTRTRKER